MRQEELDLRVKYNQVLAREKKGEAWLDDPARTDAEAEKWLPLFQKILAELNALIGEIGHSTAQERLEGFQVAELLGREVAAGGLPEGWGTGGAEASLFSMT